MGSRFNLHRIDNGGKALNSLRERLYALFMCSAITHAALGLAIGRIGTGVRMPVRYWAAAAVLGVLPDVDGLRRSFGLGWDEGMWGHRGVTHSLPAAVLTAGVVTMALFPFKAGSVPTPWASPIPKWQVWATFAAAMASHGLTDMLTNRGAGVTLFAPVSLYRSKWAFTPVEVSPMSVSAFFNERAWVILWSEFRWVLLPALMVVVAVEIARRKVFQRSGTA
jgi:inner membrane protein